jgi:hypothetical protein
VLQPSPLKRESHPEIEVNAKKVNKVWIVNSIEETRVVGSQEFFMFPRGFIFGVIIPLNLVELSGLVVCDPVLLVENLGGVCFLCQIWFQWDDIFNNNIGRCLQTSFELGDIKYIMRS